MAKVEEHKILLVGRFDVGKTAIIERFIFQQFPMEYGATQEALCSKQCIVDGEMISVDILEITTHDYAGAHSIRSQIINCANGLLLVYSITSRIALDEIQEIYQHVLQTKGRASFPTILIGNKCDLDYDRRVTFAEGKKLAEQLGCPFFEVSAKNNINVGEVFYGLVREIRRDGKGQNDKPTPLTMHDHNDTYNNDSICCSGCLMH